MYLNWPMGSMWMYHCTCLTQLISPITINNDNKNNNKQLYWREKRNRWEKNCNEKKSMEIGYVMLYIEIQVAYGVFSLFLITESIGILTFSVPPWRVEGTVTGGVVLRWIIAETHFFSFFLFDAKMLLNYRNEKKFWVFDVILYDEHWAVVAPLTFIPCYVFSDRLTY